MTQEKVTCCYHYKCKVYKWTYSLNASFMSLASYISAQTFSKLNLFLNLWSYSMILSFLLKDQTYPLKNFWAFTGLVLCHGRYPFHPRLVLPPGLRAPIPFHILGDLAFWIISFALIKSINISSSVSFSSRQIKMLKGHSLKKKNLPFLFTFLSTNLPLSDVIYAFLKSNLYWIFLVSHFIVTLQPIEMWFPLPLLHWTH